MEISIIAEGYKSISTIELLQILEHPDQYTEEAVQAAKNELESRALSNEEISESRLLLKQMEAESALKSERSHKFNNKLQAAKTAIIDTLVPIDDGILSPVKISRLIILIFAFFFFYHAISNFRILKYYFIDVYYNPLSGTFSLFLFLLLPFSIFLLWKKKRTGWIGLMIYMVVVAVLNLMVDIEALYVYFITPVTQFWVPDGWVLSQISYLIFYVSCIYGMANEKVREIYSIDQQLLIKTIVMSAVLTFLFLMMTRNT